MYIQQTDGISYRMKEPFDFGFLKNTVGYSRCSMIRIPAISASA